MPGLQVCGGIRGAHVLLAHRGDEAELAMLRNKDDVEGAARDQHSRHRTLPTQPGASVSLPRQPSLFCPSPKGQESPSQAAGPPTSLGLQLRS